MKQFNIRVYGILCNDKNQVLVSDELIKGKPVVKFPGGGLEYGEGTITCVKREFMEEAEMEITVMEHFYTTDFFQPSAFNKDHQIISIYYLVKCEGTFSLQVTDKIGEFVQDVNHEQHFRWINLKNISEDDFTLPIDKVVGKLLQQKHSVKNK